MRTDHRNGIFRDAVVKTAHVVRSGVDSVNDFALHLFDEFLFFDYGTKLFTDLLDGLVVVLFQFFLRTELIHKITDSVFDFLVNLIVGDLDTVEFRLIQHQLAEKLVFKDLAPDA